ncbi:hypothetical protein D3C81_1978280 [compost metagenome]
MEKYHEQEVNTGIKVWIAFFVKFEEYKVDELLFFPNSYFMNLIKHSKDNVYSSKLRIDKQYGRDLFAFLDYIVELRKIRQV